MIKVHDKKDFELQVKGKKRYPENLQISYV